MDSTEQSNDRLIALDLARFVAMLLMMQGHVLDALVSQSFIDVSVFPWSRWHALRGVTAPLFLMVSGVVHVIAAKRGGDGLVRQDILQRRTRWALTIIGVGYLMHFPANRIWDLPFIDAAAWPQFLSVNILHLTGAAMLILTVLLRRTTSVQTLGRAATLVAGVVLLITPWASQLANSWWMPMPIAPYIGFTQWSMFPLAPFAAYLFIGVAIGSYLWSCPSERRSKLMAYGIPAAGALVVVVEYFINMTIWKSGVHTDFFGSPASTTTFMSRVGVVLLVFGASYHLARWTRPLHHWYMMFGRRALYIYVIHIVMLWGTPWWDGIARSQYRALTLEQGLGVMALIMCATLGIVWAIDAFARSSASPLTKKRARYTFYAVMAFLLLVGSPLAWF
jgi:uncharacterized membrane protein